MNSLIKQWSQDYGYPLTRKILKNKWKQLISGSVCTSFSKMYTIRLPVLVQTKDDIYACVMLLDVSVYPHRAGLKNMPGHGGVNGDW